jgi:predicted aspartyl protease
MSADVAFTRTQSALRWSIVAVFCTAAALAAQDIPHVTSFELTRDKPFVQVMVNGKGPYRFVVDTGTAGEAFVSNALADELHLPVVGAVHLTDPSHQGGQHVPVVAIDALEVAGVEFRGVRAVRHALSQADGSCDGLLGFGLFRQYLLTLDYPHKQLSLTEGAVTPDGGGSVLPFRTPYGIPIISLKVGDLELPAQIDSGGTGLSIPDSFAARLKFGVDPELFGFAESFSTRFELRSAQLASDVRVGDYVFPQPFVEVQSAFPLANLGSSVMQGFALTFDQKHGLVRFLSSAQTHHLGATPTATILENSPKVELPAMALIPAG